MPFSQGFLYISTTPGAADLKYRITAVSKEKLVLQFHNHIEHSDYLSLHHYWFWYWFRPRLRRWGTLTKS